MEYGEERDQQKQKEKTLTETETGKAAKKNENGLSEKDIAYEY